MRVAGYRRVSTMEQIQGESLNTQTKNIKEFGTYRGWDLVKIYEDRGISGAKAEKRPGFMQMIKDAEKGEFEAIVFSKLSRFSRNAGDFLRYRDKLKEHGVLLFSIKEGLDPTSKTGKLMMGFLSLIAEWDKENIQEQMSENKIERWKNKVSFIGQPAYGYRWDKVEKKLFIDEYEADIYKRIVSMYIDLKISFQDIAIKLREEGIKCKRKDFSSQMISYMLKNPAYYGNYTLNKFYYEDGSRGAGTRRTSKEKPKAQHITFEIPALISKSDWDRIQESTQANKFKAKRSTWSKDYWLRDILECGECGASIKPKIGNKRNDGTRPAYYACYWAKTSRKEREAKNKGKCSLPLIRTEQIEDEVWQRIMTLLTLGKAGKEKHLAPLFDPRELDKKLETLTNVIEVLKVDLRKIKASRNKLYEAFEDEAFDKNELKDRLRLNKDKQLDIESKLEKSEQDHQFTKEAKENNELWKSFLKDKQVVLKQIAHELENINPVDKKRLAEGMIDGKIKIYRDEEFSEKGYGLGGYMLRGNTAILKQFMEEGKLGVLNKNSIHNIAEPYLC